MPLKSPLLEKMKENLFNHSDKPLSKQEPLAGNDAITQTGMREVPEMQTQKNRTRKK